MNSVQPINYRYTPQDLCLGPDIEFTIIGDPIPPLVLEEENDYIIRPFFAQSGINEKVSVIDTEVEGTSPLGDVIANAIDAHVVTATPPQIVTLDEALRRPNKDGILHEVKEFLSRPYLIQAGDLASTDTATTFSYKSCFQAMIASNMFTSKLRGAYIIRATTNITLQINGNRMQQGRYILAFMPTGGMETDGAQFDNYYFMHRYTKCEITQLQHVNLDINCDTQGVLVVPYQSNVPGFCFNTSNWDHTMGDPGVFFLYPYVPLASASGSTLASYQIFVHYTDVEIEGVGVAQAGRSVKKSKGDVLKIEANSTHPISSTLNTISSVTSSLMGIPMLSGIMSASAVITDALANAAYTLGWSKPIFTQPPVLARKTPFPYLNVSDAHDVADQLALTLNNNVGVVSGYGVTDKDELTIDFLKSISSWVSTTLWDTSHVHEIILQNIAFHPILPISHSDGRNTLYSWPTIAFLAACYTYWRGSITYTMKFTKTEFHSGRLLIRFIPFDNMAYLYPGVTTNNKPYMLKAIVDIRECNEFSFTVPFVYPKHWAETDVTTGIAGNIEISVLDRLVAPATVSSSVYYSIEVSGGPDFEISVPAQSPSNPGTFSTTKDLWATVPFTLQAGTVEGRSDCTLGTTVIGNASIGSENFANQAACHGEVTRSLRPLLKRGGFMDLHFADTVSNPNVFELAPRWIELGSSDVGVVGGIRNTDPYNYIAPLYCSVRGGMRIKGLCLVGGTTEDATILSSIYINKYIHGNRPQQMSSTSDNVADITTLKNANVVALNHAREGGFSVQIPQYSRTPAMSVGDQMYKTSVSATEKSTRCPVTLNVGFSQYLGTMGSIPTTLIHRSVADDFNLAGFVSVPCTKSVAV